MHMQVNRDPLKRHYCNKNRVVGKYVGMLREALIMRVAMMIMSSFYSAEREVSAMIIEMR
jgi:hypothetical protein